MPLPIVAVVGRPNVGKSTFVNRIAQANEAIVHEMRGVTRDRSYHEADWNGCDFKLIDTGGIEMGDDDAFQGSIRSQAFAGANEADVIVFLVDGKTGINADDEEVARVLRRTSKPVFLAVNKMDLVDFSRERFNEIAAEYRRFIAPLGIPDLQCIPLSALEGDNVVERSARTPWYQGVSLLEFLETVEIDRDINMQDFRFPVQYVLRPNLDFRGFSGKIASGVIHRGDEVMALPSGKRSRVKEIVTYDGNPEYAFAPQSVTLTLEDEIDLSRGEMLIRPDNRPQAGHHIQAMLVWMDEQPMDRSKSFFLKHTTHTTRARIGDIDYRVDINTMDHLPAERLALNEIGLVSLSVADALLYDPYTENRATGAFILIDPVTNYTSAVGMILGADPRQTDTPDEDRIEISLAELNIDESHREAVERICEFLRERGINIICTKK